MLLSLYDLYLNKELIWVGVGGYICRHVGRVWVQLLAYQYTGKHARSKWVGSWGPQVTQGTIRDYIMGVTAWLVI